MTRYLVSLLLLVSGLFGCAPIPQAVPPTVLPPSIAPTQETCSENPEHLMLKVLFGKRDERFQRITLNGIGFLAGEQLTIRVMGKGSQRGMKIETYDYPVQEDGSFSTDYALQLVDPDMHWEVHVVHQRGTACLQFSTGR